jgi:hypothetical protein
VARAKRTDRAEARRQYRAYLAAQAEAQAAAEAEDAETPSEDRGASTRPARPRDLGGSPEPGVRLGMAGAAKAAFRTPHYLDDLRNIGPLAVRTNAVWPVAALCLISALIAYPRINPQTVAANDTILAIIFQFVLYPLPLLPPMIAGFFAPRSTWLAGILASAIAVVTLVVLLVVTRMPIESVNGQVSGGRPIQDVGVAGVTLSWLSAALPFGALMGAGAGWYKRFLDYMGAGSQRRTSKSSSQKRPARRSRTTRH